MGWFDEQIRARKKNDDAFAEAFANMASAITGKKGAALNSDRAATKSAIDEILKYYHVKSREIPESITDRNEQLEYLMRPYGIMRRTVKLEGTWYLRCQWEPCWGSSGEREGMWLCCPRGCPLQLL